MNKTGIVSFKTLDFFETFMLLDETDFKTIETMVSSETFMRSVCIWMENNNIVYVQKYYF